MKPLGKSFRKSLKVEKPLWSRLVLHTIVIFDYEGSKFGLKFERLQVNLARGRLAQRITGRTRTVNNWKSTFSTSERWTGRFTSVNLVESATVYKKRSARIFSEHSLAVISALIVQLHIPTPVNKTVWEVARIRTILRQRPVSLIETTRH